jgi:hypothetical protein
VIAFAVQSTTVNNAITIYVAGQGGAALTSAQIAAVQAFFNSFHMLTDVVTVASPTTRTITLALTGSITVKQALLASAQAALQSSLQTYLSGVDAAAPLGINGLVDYDYIVSLIRRTPGVTHVPAGGALTINTVAADLQLPVTPGAYEVAIWSQDVKTAFTWATV